VFSLVNKRSGVFIITKKKLSLKFLKAGELLDMLKVPNAFSYKLFGVFVGKTGRPVV